MSKSHKILFVDDEPEVLESIDRILTICPPEWRVKFAQNGRDALDIMDSEDLDIIVTDIRMSGVSGMKLLAMAKQVKPDAIRIALSGVASRPAALGSTGPIHLYLSKPCKPAILISTITRSCELLDLVNRKKIRRKICNIESIPSFPASYENLLTELQSSTSSISRVAKIVSEDIGMTAKLLQIYSTQFLGDETPVTNLFNAVNMLGLDSFRKLAIMPNGIFQLAGMSEVINNNLDLRKSSILTSRIAREIARSEQVDQTTIEDSFVAGLLLDTGKLIIALYLGDECEQKVYIGNNRNQWDNQDEKDRFGSTHAELGAFLLGLWGLNDSIVNAVTFHHEPAKSDIGSFNALTAVHVAQAIVGWDYESGAYVSGEICGVDNDYLAQAGFKDRLHTWANIGREIVSKGVLQ